LCQRESAREREREKERERERETHNLLFLGKVFTSHGERERESL